MKTFAWVCRCSGCGIAVGAMLPTGAPWWEVVIGVVALFAFVDASIYLAKKELQR